MDVSVNVGRLGAAAATFISKPHKLLIDGKWVAAQSGNGFGVFDPATGGQIVWRLGDLLEKHADELAEIESIDNGKPVMDARMVDGPLSCELLRYMAGWATKITGQTIPISAPGEWHAYSMRDVALPFYKQSGWGRKMGHEAIDLYTEVKAVATML